MRTSHASLDEIYLLLEGEGYNIYEHDFYWGVTNLCWLLYKKTNNIFRISLWKFVWKYKINIKTCINISFIDLIFLLHKYTFIRFDFPSEVSPWNLKINFVLYFLSSRCNSINNSVDISLLNLVKKFLILIEMNRIFVFSFLCVTVNYITYYFHFVTLSHIALLNLGKVSFV